MKNILITLAVAGLLIMNSCKEEKKEEGPSQMEQVMAVHDEVMPKMGAIGKLVGQLKPLADSLGSDSPEAKAMKDLQAANTAMMEWMHSFGDTFDAAEIIQGKALSEDKKALLNAEQEKINQVKKAINTSIANAEALLKE